MWTESRKREGVNLIAAGAAKSNVATTGNKRLHDRSVGPRAVVDVGGAGALFAIGAPKQGRLITSASCTSRKPSPLMSSCARLLAILLSTVAAVVPVPATSATTHALRVPGNQHAIAQQIKAGRVGQGTDAGDVEWTGSVRACRHKQKRAKHACSEEWFSGSTLCQRTPACYDIGIIVTSILTH